MQRSSLGVHDGTAASLLGLLGGAPCLSDTSKGPVSVWGLSATVMNVLYMFLPERWFSFFGISARDSTLFFTVVKYKYTESEIRCVEKRLRMGLGG